MTRAATAQINLSAIKHNYRLAKSLFPGSKAMAIVKANAYGHGAVEVAINLASEADAFGVACLEEAIRLRAAGITNRLLLLEGFFDTSELQKAAELNLDTTIHSKHQLQQFLDSELGHPINVWLKLDTGMHRLGFSSEEFLQAYRHLANSNKVSELVLMSHFSRADETASNTTLDQVAQFKKTTADLPNPISLANSPAILSWPESKGEWIRPGMMLYGSSPLDQDNDASRQLIPAMTLESEVIAVKTLKTGDSIGYGATYRCPGPTKVAVIAMGYGDGYPRQAKNGTPVLVNGIRCPLIGRVSMDMLTVDVSAIKDVSVGDSAVFWGQDLPLAEVAEFCDTISYELVTRLTGRAPLKYTQ
ncbi:alanine racemase [Motiliproteus sp. MSK22-1]|uniref:alanine racemase n=1 Tax=Motiliproteus sp. MSK22-1 TaxID=1897630 RepID=UPI0009759EE5|nr:alanine racemase [Motiliproteus sp. MSK22-1]OMH25902.1 alanine racemase [Motiliproteus sp. MSK22-1]